MLLHFAATAIMLLHFDLHFAATAIMLLHFDLHFAATAIDYDSLTLSSLTKEFFSIQGPLGS